MATVRTTLNLGITSSSDMKGVDDAQAKLAELKAQIDSIRSQRLDIAANTAQMDEAIARSKAELSQLQEQMRNGELDANDYRVQAKLDELKQEIRDFRNEKIQLGLDDAQLKTEMARLKVELDDLTHDRKIKIDADTTGLMAKMAAAKTAIDTQAKETQDAWNKAATNMRQSALSIGQAIALLAPALIPIGAAALGVGISAVSAFTGGAAAAGVFGFTLKSAWTSASQVASTNQTLNQTLTAQKGLLATLTPGSAQYNSVQQQIAQTQSQITANMNSQGPVIAGIAQKISDLSNQWHSARDSMISAGGGAQYLNSGMSAVSDIIKVMPPIFEAVSTALEPLRQQFDAFFGGNGLKGVVDWVIAYGVPNFVKFVEVLRNLGITFAQMVGAFSNNGATMMSWLVRITGELDKWGQNGGFQRFAEYIKSIGPTVERTLGSIGLALQHLAVAAQSVSLPSLNAITIALDLIARLPVGAIQAVYVAFVAYKGLNFLGALFQGVKNGINGVQLAMTAARGIILGFQAGLAGVNATAEDGTAILVGNKIAIIGQSAASGVAAAATKVWSAATTAFNVVTSVSTYQLIAQKVASLATAAASGVASAATKVWSAATAAFSAVTETSTVKLVAQKVASLAQAAASGVANVATKAWTAVTVAFDLATSASTYSLVAQRIATIAQAVASGIASAATKAWGAVVAVYNALAATSTARIVAQTVVEYAQAIATGVVTAATWAYDAAAGVADLVSLPIIAVFGAIVLAAAALGVAIYLLATHWSTVWNGIKDVATGVWDTMKTAWKLFTDTLVSISESFEGIFKGAWSLFWDGIKSAAMAVWDAIRTSISVWFDLIKGLFLIFKDFFTGNWSGMWDQVKQTASKVWDDIKSGFGRFWGDIENGIQGAVNAVGRIWGTVVDKFKTPVNDLIGIWNTVAGAIGLPKIGTIGGTSGSTGAGGNTASAGASAIPAAAGSSGSTGPVKAFASGGRITGPGTGTSDSVPIWASHGEFMMPADTVQHYGLNVMESMRSKRFARGGLISHDGAPGYGIGGIIGGALNIGKKVVGAVAGAVTGPLKALESIPGIGGLVSKLVGVAATAVYDVTKPVVGALVNSIPDPVPGIFKPAGSVPRAGVKTLGDELLNKLKAAQAQAQAVMASMGGTIPSGEHKAIIDQALAKAGIPQSQWPMWEAGLNTLITRESGWNPSAINLTDSNAAAGHPSQGLMQTIPSTFAAYGLGGSITDPVSNIVAGIRYIMARYGGIQNVQQANANMSPKGYDTGGPLPRGLTLVNNTTGTMEGVLNPTGLNAIGGLGSLTALNSGRATFMSATASSATSGASMTVGAGGRTVTISMPIEINAPNADASQVVDEVERRILPKLTTILTAGVGTQ